MFNSPSKQQLENLQEANASLVSKLEELSSKSASDVVIVKLLTNDSNNFYFNGDYVCDESKAIYKSNEITFSEAVMYKAGKVAAERELDHTFDDLKAELCCCKQELTNKTEMIEELSRQIAVYKNSIQELRNQLSDSTQTQKKFVEDAEEHQVIELTKQRNKYEATIASLQRELQQARKDASKLPEVEKALNDLKKIIGGISH